jgi:DNA-directed RNA polymerase beta' subunit
VYDVTVPGTYNFTLKNGLCIHDTSETGYLQRKLVKAMEDCKINYDYTVRNASGSIIQFIYGEDGMDPIKIEAQSLPYIEMDYQRLRSEYLLTPEDDLEHITNNTKMSEKALREHFEQVVEDREFMITKIFKNRQNNSFMYPVSFTRIINNAKAMMSKYSIDKCTSDLSPSYILEAINTLSEELFINPNNKGNKFIQIMIRAWMSPKQVLLKYRLNKEVFDYVITQIKTRFFEAIAHPSEMVGVVAAQSIGEPCTQLTLNSVDWHTELLLKVDDNLERVKIGDYIDRIVSMADKEHTEEHPNDTKLVWIKEKNVQVLSCDEDGKIKWEQVEAVTKHPPINKDGSNTLLKVTLQSGRSVIATKAKSFLKRHNNKIVEINGDELNVGDYLPVSTILPIEQSMQMTTLDLSRYLSKKEFVFMTEVQKARKEHSSGGHWWKRGSFKLPYSRPDSFARTFINNLGEQTYVNGCVYPKKCHYTTTTLPENMPLDERFGFMVGAYAAEGCTTQHHVLISNNDADFNAKVDMFCKQYNIGYHTDHRVLENGTTTLRLHSLVLAKLFSSMLGKGSSNKRLPPWILQAPTEFKKGVIDGYFSGDGTVTKNDRNVISASSTSHGLLEDIQQILVMFDIQSTIHPHDTPRYEEKRNRFQTTQMSYKLSISCGNTKRFAEQFKLTILEKQSRLAAMLDKNTYFTYSRNDIVPDIITQKYGCISVHRDKLSSMVNDPTLCKADKQVFENVLSENIAYDRVKSIEEVVSDHPYVYDLTVSNTKNFNLYNGLAMRDTFHHSGISSASKAVRGVPRIKELLSVTKNIKAPSMTVYLNPTIKSDKMRANEVLKSVQTTFFKDIVKSSKIYYDASDFNTGVEDDKEFVKTYKELMDLDLIKDVSTAPWLLRIEINRDRLLDEGINMMSLYHILQEYYEDMITCMFSDDNSHNLVFRIKLIEDLSNNADEDRDYITELKALEKNIMENIVIKGVKNVNKAMMNKQDFMEYNPETMQFDKANEWIIDTSGTNLIDVMAHPKVDFTRTISNDINEIYDLLGVEAARAALYNELSGVIADAELYVNYRHIALLVDTMTNRGYLLSIDRHGINRVDIGPLAKCSFEETTDMLIKAGIFSEVDKITGVSANIMLGQIPPCGTGDSEVLIDELKLMNILDSEMAAEEVQPTESLYEDLCGMDNLAFDFTLPPANSVDVPTVNDFEVAIK